MPVPLSMPTPSTLPSATPPANVDFTQFAPSAAGDGLLEGGSFEGLQGKGWDTCYTHYPGFVIAGRGPDLTAPALVSASAGDYYAVFSADCLSYPKGDQSQVYLWFKPVFRIGGPHYLWFDLRELGPTDSNAELTILGTTAVCKTNEVLARVSFNDFHVGNQWAPRCLTLRPSFPDTAIGLLGTGATLKIGMDSLRFGTSCPLEPVQLTTPIPALPACL